MICAPCIFNLNFMVANSLPSLVYNFIYSWSQGAKVSECVLAPLKTYEKNEMTLFRKLLRFLKCRI